MNETSLEENVEWTVGIDSGSREHVVRMLDAGCHSVGKHKFEHSGRGIGTLIDWVLKGCNGEPNRVAVATEAPHGPVVEGLLERGCGMYAMNPKQMAGFRGRMSPAEVKDDERDAWILAQTLRVDTYAYRRVELGGALYVRLRDLSRTRQKIEKEIVRLTNYLWQHLHRYFPQMLGVGSMEEAWVRELWKRAPSPERAQRLTQRWVAQLLRTHRISRTSAAAVLQALQAPPVPAAPGVVESAIAQIEYALPRLTLLMDQRKRCERELEALLQEMQDEPAPDPGAPAALSAEGLCLEERADQDALAPADQPGEENAQPPSDVAVILSCPGAGVMVASSLLSEAPDLIRDRDYAALRCHGGTAPVTCQSGTVRRVTMRYACNPRIRNGVRNWALKSLRSDPNSRAYYDDLRAAGVHHERALRSVADRWLRILTAMLREHSLYDPTRCVYRARGLPAHAAA